MDNDLLGVSKKKHPVLDIVVRVDKVEEPRKVEGSIFECLKFMVANEKALRIQCMAMEDQIERIRPLIKKNTIIRIKGAIPKKEADPKNNDGDVPFVLLIYASTVITLIKDCDPDDKSEGCQFANTPSSKSRVDKVKAERVK